MGRKNKKNILRCNDEVICIAKAMLLHHMVPVSWVNRCILTHERKIRENAGCVRVQTEQFINH